MKNDLADATQRYHEIEPDDLPLHCPNPRMTLWDSHPRVFLTLDSKGEATCPYCGTLYKLRGQVRKHH